MNDPLSKPHAVDRLLKEDVWYPPHTPRKETPEYRAVHHKLVVELDLPCLVCGVKNSTLSDPKENKKNSKQIELHHHIVEWALANAISLDKFNQRILPHLKMLHPESYDEPLTQQELLDWIDHSPHNLWALCDVCHRHALFGIHAITYPIWVAQDLIRDDFIFISPKETSDVDK